MIIQKRNSSKILSWLFEEPLANTVPSLHILDKALGLLSKISYIIIRIIIRTIIGKEKRGFYKQRISFSVNFSFYLFMNFYKIIRLLRLGNPTLIKIYVPKYDYKIYCPPTIEDFFNLTLRETEIIEKFCPKKNDIVLDVGAHLGRYTIISSKLVGNNGKVISFEASPIVFEKLKRNIELNNLTNTTSLNYAVYSEKTSIKLFCPIEGLKNTVYNSIIADRSRDLEKFVNVDANTLDNILNLIRIQQENVNWIKIDVEGAELEVLKGAHNILSKSKNIALLIEIHNFDNKKNLYIEIIELLKNYNFKIEFEKIHETGERHIIVRKQSFMNP